MRAPFAFIKKGGVWQPNNASVPVIAWYLADNAHNDGTGHVDSWPDVSGSGDVNKNLGQPTAGIRPALTSTNASYGNRPTVTGTGPEQLVRPGAWSTSPPKPITVVIVGQIVGNPNSILSCGGAAVTNLFWGNGPVLKFLSNGIGPLYSSAAFDVPSVALFSDDGSGGASAANIYVNNLSTPNVSGTTVFDLSTLGFDIGPANFGVSGFSGEIAEIIVFSGILSATDIANLKTYLNSTRAYGIPVT